jgi:hypothetical protein
MRSRQLTRLLLTIYRRHLRTLLATAPPWVGEDVLNASAWREHDAMVKPSID